MYQILNDGSETTDELAGERQEIMGENSAITPLERQSTAKKGRAAEKKIEKKQICTNSFNEEEAGHSLQCGTIGCSYFSQP